MDGGGSLLVVATPAAALGPALCAIATLQAMRITPDTNYWTAVMPLECLFGTGLATMVPPLTSVALSSVPGEHTGITSAVNNAVSRSAALPPIVGLTGASDARATCSCPATDWRASSASSRWSRQVVWRRPFALNGDRIDVVSLVVHVHLGRRRHDRRALVARRCRGLRVPGGRRDHR